MVQERKRQAVAVFKLANDWEYGDQINCKISNIYEHRYFTFEVINVNLSFSGNVVYATVLYTW